MNIFAQASKQKLLFASNKGQVSLQDLWDLPLSTLKNMANTINRNLSKSDDLFATVTVDESVNKLRLSVILEVIDIRNQELENKVNEKEKEAKRKFIKDLINQKKLEATSGMSIEDLEKELDKLG